MSFVRDRFASSVELFLRAHVAEAMSLSFPCSFSAEDPTDMAHALRWCADIMRRGRCGGEGGCHGVHYVKGPENRRGYKHVRA